MTQDRSELAHGQRWLATNPAIDRDAIVRNWNGGYRIERIAADLGVGKTTARCVLIALGATMGRSAKRRARPNNSAAYVGPEYEWVRVNKPLIVQALQAFR